MSDFISTTDAIAAKRGKRPTPKRVIGIIVGVVVGAALCIGIGFGALGLLNDALGKAPGAHRAVGADRAEQLQHRSALPA